jgi:hypothetical protein
MWPPAWLIRLWMEYRQRRSDHHEAERAAALLGCSVGPLPLLDDQPAALVEWAAELARIEEEVAECLSA